MAQNVALLTRGGFQNVALLDRAAGAAEPAITTTALDSGIGGAAYSDTVVATGDTPITWSAISLPAGLSIATGTGVISGVAAAGSYTIVVTATNASGYDTQSVTLVLSNPVSGGDVIPTGGETSIANLSASVSIVVFAPDVLTETESTWVEVESTDVNWTEV